MPPKRVYVGNLPRDCRKSELEDLFRDFKPDDITVKEAGFAFLIFDDPRDAEEAIQELDGSRFSGRRIRVEPAGRWGSGPGRRGGGDRSPPRRRSPPRSRYRSRSPPSRRSPYGGGYDRPPRRGNYRVVIEDVPHNASWQDLKDFARDHGCHPAGTDIVVRAGEGRDVVGLLEFATRGEMDDAINRLDKAKMNPGRGARHHYPATTIRAMEDNDSELFTRGRGGGGGGYRSRSRRRSRSRSRRRSRSGGRGRSRSAPRKSRSRDRDASRDRGSRDRKASVSVEREKDSKRDVSKERSRERSRSRSRERSRSRDQKPEKRSRERSRESRSRERSKSRDD